MGYASVIETKIGTMLVPDRDQSQTGTLQRTGLPHGWGEMAMISDVVQKRGKRGMFLDAGACIGTWTLHFASHEMITEVHAFEPQNALCNCIAGSCALNGFTNVTCHPEAVGTPRSIPVPQFDYQCPMEFGSVNMGDSQKEPLSQQRKPDSAQFCRVVSLDDFAAVHKEPVAFLKLDIEGMELEALLSGAGMIAANRPILFVEFMKSDKEIIRSTMEGMGYSLTEHGPDFLGIPSP